MSKKGVSLKDSGLNALSDFFHFLRFFQTKNPEEQVASSTAMRCLGINPECIPILIEGKVLVTNGAYTGYHFIEKVPDTPSEIKSFGDKFKARNIEVQYAKIRRASVFKRGIVSITERIMIVFLYSVKNQAVESISKKTNISPISIERILKSELSKKGAVQENKKLAKKGYTRKGKWTEERVRKLIEMHRDGFTYKEIADQFQEKESAVKGIICRVRSKTSKHNLSVKYHSLYVEVMGQPKKRKEEYVEIAEKKEEKTEPAENPLKNEIDRIKVITTRLDAIISSLESKDKELFPELKKAYDKVLQEIRSIHSETVKWDKVVLASHKDISGEIKALSEMVEREFYKQSKSDKKLQPEDVSEIVEQVVNSLYERLNEESSVISSLSECDTFEAQFEAQDVKQEKKRRSFSLLNGWLIKIEW